MCAQLRTDSIYELDDVVVKAQALKVYVVEDTIVYNSAAYRTPEGSVVEELIKRLPGASVDDEGNVTINGKKVERVKVDGREFMTGDTKTAVKNLPTSIVDKVKAYADKSDNAKATGIDDGEEIMTLDFGVKEGMNKGLLGNFDLSYGTRERYSEKGMLAWFKNKWRVMAMGSANNTNDMGFGGRGGGFSRGRNGLNTAEMAGVNFNYEETNKLKVDGSVRWNHSTNDAQTTSSSEQFVTSTTAVQSFSNDVSQSLSRDRSWNAQARVEWKPDTLNTVTFRPTFSYTRNGSESDSNSATFSDDPYTFTTDPLAQLTILESVGLIKNSQLQNAYSNGSSKSVGGQAQWTRKFGSQGRNISLRVEGNLSTNDADNFSSSAVSLYGNDDDYMINRYNVTPSNSHDFTLRASYSEPIARKTYLQFTYGYKYSYSKSDRSTYDFGEETTLPDDYTNYLDEDLSRFSEYRTYTQNIRVQLRRIRDKYNLSIGAEVEPQQTNFKQQYLGVVTDTTRNVINIAPMGFFRYQFNKQHVLRARYRGTTSQPSMSDMISITDDSDPLNITIGNPGLKPSFTHNLTLNYNNYIAEHTQVIEFHGSASATRNATTRRVTYDTTTGGRTTRPENINGNWDASAGGMYNISLDRDARWNVNLNTDYSFNNYVGLVSESETASSERNVTKSHNITEKLAGSYRNDWLELELDGQVNYTRSTNEMQPTANLNTTAFSYGASTTISLPWGMSFSSDCHMRSRRGYSDASLNTNELIWNAQLAQSFLKGKALTLTLQCYDILGQQSNLSRTLNAMMRQDTEYTAINSYCMLHAIYRFNLMGGKEMPRPGDRPGDGERPDFSRPEFREGGPGCGPGGMGGGPGGMGGPPPGM